MRISGSMKVAGAALAALLASAGGAYAATGNGSFAVSNENVRYDGSVTWYPNAQKVDYGHGGMVVSGYLYDTRCNGHWVYVSAKVAGYGYTRLRENHDGCGTRVWDGATEVYDGAATYVTDGYVKACQDDDWADTCTAEYMTRS